MERASEETLPPENTRERMSDRPASSEEADLDRPPGALNDTDLEPGGESSVDDV